MNIQFKYINMKQHLIKLVEINFFCYRSHYRQVFKEVGEMGAPISAKDPERIGKEITVIIHP